MGGQACVLYGAAEFSRDINFLIEETAESLQRLQSALDELRAEVIAVPPFQIQYLRAGLAVHFRSQHPEAEKLRIDVMSRQRGMDSFNDLWERRTTFEDIDLLSLPDLVKAKKTQRDKDWPMLSRLVEVSYFEHPIGEAPTPHQLDFWFSELRSPELLLDLAARFPGENHRFSLRRPLLALTEPEELRRALKREEEEERERDRQYWVPLRQQLEQLRKNRPV